MSYTQIDNLAVNTIRTLSIDAIEKANSGHPGLPMGAAPMAYVLWTRFMRYNPGNPAWFNRDRFVLSAGHGSMLLYSLLHLTGYDVSIEDLKQFRQWGSKTPGHPEFGHTPGVDATAGPLGQGLSMAVGMAMAERFLAAKFNQPGHEVVDHHTYVLAGDGDMMEGVASEAASLAGHLGLHKLVVLYDSNDISLDGPTNWAFTENVADRYRAYGWNVLRVEDGNDLEEIERAIAAAKTESGRPTLIEVKTIIGFGSPKKQGTKSAHGEPLGVEESAKAKETYQWPHEPFHVPHEVAEQFAQVKAAGQATESAWNDAMEKFGHEFPELAQALVDAIHGQVRVDWDAVLPAFSGDVATRDALGKVMNELAAHIPTLLGGSADLSSSNKTLLAGEEHFSKESYAGRNVFYGVREHAMGAALNGLTLHGGVIPYDATFLVFADYLRPAMRMSALMKQPVLHIFTHDSVAVGEDGPTHEPIEQIASIRAIPGFKMFRPADATETALSVRYALEHRDAPVALALSRQKLPTLDEVKQNQANFAKGGYVLYENNLGGNASDWLIFLATGSEVQLALAAAKRLAAESVAVRVVSLPSLEVFEEQEQAYKEQVLPAAATKRVAIEMGHPMPWYKYVGFHGCALGIDHFGASAPGDVVMAKFGFTVNNVVELARELL